MVVKLNLNLFFVSNSLRVVDLWSDRDTYKFLIFKVFMMNDILFMTQYAL